jgi:flagellar biosynthesis protein FlhF
MQTKAYFSSSVPAALAVARQELGENALLVSSRPAPPEVRQFGRLEVTFAWDPKEMSRRRFEPAATSASAVKGSPMAEKLVMAGFSPAAASEMATGAARRSGDPNAAVVHELASRIPVVPFAEMKPGERRTLAFIGPPGRGKTTSLVKIAVSLGLSRNIPVRIYCAGAHGVGAQEQLARFATILDAEFMACESLASLNLALNEHEREGLTLIDTPGISPADRIELAELKSFFDARAEIEKHLVLRADASSADMLHMISRFSVLTPSRILVTGMDEAISVAPMIEGLIRGGIPATFVGTGQQIPEDLEEVNAERLARAAWAAGVTEGKYAQAAA